MVNGLEGPLPSSPRRSKRSLRRSAAVAGVSLSVLVSAGLAVARSGRGESFEERAEQARAETEMELSALAAGLDLSIRDLSSLPAREAATDPASSGSNAQATAGAVQAVMYTLTGGEEQAHLVLEHLTKAGYSLVAEDCSSWGWAGVFTNAAGESLQATVSERSIVSLTAGIGMDHERLAVSEVPLVDLYDSHDCWPSL